MIHLDTNILIDIVTAGSPQVEMVRGWLKEGKKLAASAIAWSEFCNGPHSSDQKNAVFAILQKKNPWPLPVRPSLGLGATLLGRHSLVLR